MRAFMAGGGGVGMGSTVGFLSFSEVRYVWVRFRSGSPGGRHRGAVFARGGVGMAGTALRARLAPGAGLSVLPVPESFAWGEKLVSQRLGYKSLEFFGVTVGFDLWIGACRLTDPTQGCSFISRRLKKSCWVFQVPRQWRAWRSGQGLDWGRSP